MEVLEINTVSCMPKMKNLEILFSYFEIYASEVAKIRSGGIENPLLSDLIVQYLKQKCSDNVDIVFVYSDVSKYGVNTKRVIADEGLNLSDVDLDKCYADCNESIVVFNYDSLGDFVSLCSFLKDFMRLPDSEPDQKFTLLMTQPFEPSEDMNFSISLDLDDFELDSYESPEDSGEEDEDVSDNVSASASGGEDEYKTEILSKPGIFSKEINDREISVTSVDINEVKSLTASEQVGSSLSIEDSSSYFERLLRSEGVDGAKADLSASKIKLVETNKNRSVGRNPVPLLQLNRKNEYDDLDFDDIDQTLFLSYIQRYVDLVVNFLSFYNGYSENLRQEIFDGIVLKTSGIRKIYIPQQDSSKARTGSIVKYSDGSTKASVSTLKSSINYDDKIMVIRESDMKRDDCLIQLFSAVHIQNPESPIFRPSLKAKFGCGKSFSSRCINTGIGMLSLLTDCFCILLNKPYSVKNCRAYGKTLNISCRNGKDPLFFRLAQQFRFIIGDEPLCNLMFSNNIADIENPLSEIINSDFFISRFNSALDRLAEAVERYSRFEFNLSRSSSGFHREITLGAKHREESSVLRAFQEAQNCLLNAYFSAMREDKCVSWREVYKNYYVFKAFSPLGSCWGGYEKFREAFRQDMKEMEAGSGRFGKDFLSEKREWRDIVKDESKLLGRKSRYYMLSSPGMA